MSRAHMEKRALIDTIRDMLRAELAAAERAAKETANAANHPEARPENDKDTRKIELSYLAAGQAARAKELETAIALLGTVPTRSFSAEEPLQAGALIELQMEDKAQRVFLCPAGGGLKIPVEGGEVSVVTPQSPLGRELLGKTVGEAFELRVGTRRTDVEIVAVE